MLTPVHTTMSKTSTKVRLAQMDISMLNAVKNTATATMVTIAVC